MPFGHSLGISATGWERRFTCFRLVSNRGCHSRDRCRRLRPAVSELRLHSEEGQFRTFSFTASANGILVLHAFVKKTRQTPLAEIHLARKRMKEMQDEL